MRSWSCFRIMGSVCEGRAGCGGCAAGGRRIDTQALEKVVATAAAGLQPDFVQPQDVLFGKRVGSLCHPVPWFDLRVELPAPPTTHVSPHPPLSPAPRPSPLRL